LAIAEYLLAKDWTLEGVPVPWVVDEVEDLIKVTKKVTRSKEKEREWSVEVGGK